MVDPARMERMRKGIQELVTLGALAVGPVPPRGLRVAKAKAPKAAGGA